jgi:hypothetical protein
MTTYGSKINYTILFVSHKGLACMLNTFVHISFGLFFFLNVVFKIYIVMQASKNCLFIYKLRKKNNNKMPNAILTSLLKIWMLTSQSFEVWSYSFEAIIFVWISLAILDIGIEWIFFMLLCLCWHICALRIFWSSVKYLSIHLKRC